MVNAVLKVYNNHTTHEFKSLPAQSTVGFWPIRKRVETHSFYKILKVAAENHIGRSYSDSVIKTIIGSKLPLFTLLYCLFVFTFSTLVYNVFISYLIWEAGLALWWEHLPSTNEADWGSISALGVIRGLRLLVLYSALRGFFPVTVFPSHQKLTFDLIWFE